MKQATNIATTLLIMACLQGCGFMWARAMMPDHRCAPPFTGIQAAPEMCAVNPLACPIEVTLGLAADLVVLPYDLAKPIFHEECRWDREARDGIGMSRSSFQQAVKDLARKDQLDKASTDMLEKKVKFLRGSLGFGYRGELYVEEILQALHREAVPKEELKARAVSKASDFHYVRMSLDELPRSFLWFELIDAANKMV
jgi:hypothetical protein